MLLVVGVWMVRGGEGGGEAVERGGGEAGVEFGGGAGGGCDFEGVWEGGGDGAGGSDGDGGGGGEFCAAGKGDDPLPLGANEELAAALRGKNRGQLEFISEGSPALNAQGQLVDRWGTALFFHAKGRDRVDIRSAGLDRAMWTADDVHRLHDGRYLRGADLEAPSLLEAGAVGR
jgi:hypothetical protein